MAVVLVLANIFAIILCQPLLVNHPEMVLGNDVQEIQEIGIYNYYMYEGSMNSHIFCKETFQVLIICALVFYGIIQSVKLRHEVNESECLLEKMENAHAMVARVPKFCQETEKMCGVLERKSKTVMTRMRAAERRILENGAYGKLRNDLEFVSGSWRQQLKGFQSLGVDVCDLESDVHMNVHLTMIKGLIDRELGKITKDMMEDSISLEEVERDVRILENHFRGKMVL